MVGWYTKQCVLAHAIISSSPWSFLQPVQKALSVFWGMRPTFPSLNHTFPSSITYHACMVRSSIRSVLIKAVTLHKAVASTAERFRAERDILLISKPSFPFTLCIWYDPFCYAFSHLLLSITCTIELEKHTTLI